MTQNLGEDIRRLFKDNFERTWQKYVVFLGLLLPFLAVVGLSVSDKFPIGTKLVFSGLSLLAAVLLYFFYFLIYSVRKTYRLLPPDHPSHKYVVDSLAKLFGLRKTDLKIHCVISEDGSSISTYNVHLRAEANQITQVEYLSTAPTLPDGADGDTDVKFIRSESGPGDIRVEMLRKTKAESFWAINFTPGLSAGQSVKYLQEVRTPSKTFALTPEDLKARKLDFESYSMQVNYPTDKLVMRVTFFRGASVSRVTHDAWYGRGRVRHMNEYSRIIKEESFTTGLEDGKLYGELEIPFPIHGLKYVIRWEPAAS